MSKQLSAEQERFASMLAPYPRLSTYWDFDKTEVNEQQLRNAISVMSSGEQHMARFFLGLWTGDPAGFELTEAVAVLEAKDRKLLVDWICNPFWP
ncbi:hypothetical protein [Serratia ficaria]|uniref:hypothetical protein n=1 Tax=Serratia ficaria TaxID=61651 RepID=UPI002182A6E4|nr:hypothetical protein [Serratia ficaria]CAI2537017.1 Uncharacterised protein [Serratia ficaria]